MLTAGPPARKPPERPPSPPPRGGRARTVMASDAAQWPLGPHVLSATTTTAQQATRPHPAAAGAGVSLAPAPIAYRTGVLGSTVSAAHASAQHQLVADAAQAAATNQARHPSRTLPVQTARGRLEGGPAGLRPSPAALAGTPNNGVLGAAAVLTLASLETPSTPHQPRHAALMSGEAQAPLQPSLAHAGRPYRSAELNAVGACSAWLLPHTASDADLGAAADAQRHALGDTVTGVTADTKTDTHRHAQAKRRVAAEVSVAATGSGCSGVELCMCACICI